MKKYKLIFLSVLLGMTASAQQLDTLSTEVAGFTIDKLGQIYIADIKGNVYKRQVQNDSVKYYNNTLLGAPDIISAESGINLYVYFQNFGRLQVLDNYVSLMEDLNLYEIGYNTVTLITASSDGGVWMYDIANNDLIKLSKGLKQVYDSGDLRNLIGDQMDPVFLDETEGMVFLASSSELLIFDRFANLVDKMPIPGFKNAVSQGRGYLVLTEDELLYVDAKDPLGRDKVMLPVDVQSVDRIEYYDEKLYLLMGECLVSLDATQLQMQ